MSGWGWRTTPEVFEIIGRRPRVRGHEIGECSRLRQSCCEGLLKPLRKFARSCDGHDIVQHYDHVVRRAIERTTELAQVPEVFVADVYVDEPFARPQPPQGFRRKV